MFKNKTRFWIIQNLINPMCISNAFQKNWIFDPSKPNQVHLDCTCIFKHWYLNPSKPYQTNLDFIPSRKFRISHPFKTYCPHAKSGSFLHAFVFQTLGGVKRVQQQGEGGVGGISNKVGGGTLMLEASTTRCGGVPCCWRRQQQGGGRYLVVGGG